MTTKIFVDSDVIIDFLTDRKPFSKFAIKLFELNEQKKVHIHISALSISNVYYIIRKYVKHQQAIIAVEKLTKMTEIIGTGKKEVINALQNNFKDYEDAIQHETALSITDVDAIITRNIKDYSRSKIAVFTPENYLKLKEEL